MIILTFAAIIVLVVLAICHFFGPQTRSWCSNGEEKIGLSEKKLYNANGYIVSILKCKPPCYAAKKLKLYEKTSLHLKSKTHHLFCNATGSFRI